MQHVLTIVIHYFRSENVSLQGRVRELEGQQQIALTVSPQGYEMNEFYVV